MSELLDESADASELYNESTNHQSSPMDMIRQLVNAYPDVLKLRNHSGEARLHVACKCVIGGGTLEFIQYLVEQWPESVKTTTNYGWLPLHTACFFACFFGAPLAVIQYLVEQWPESVKTTVRNTGRLPLHMFCENGKAPLPVLQYLVQQWPEAVKISDKHTGSLPLHVACANEKVTLEVVQYLVQQWPESVKQRNSHGGTPLNVAIGRQSQLAAPDMVAVHWLNLPRRDRFN
jgi:ankyrin repeat protein